MTKLQMSRVRVCIENLARVERILMEAMPPKYMPSYKKNSIKDALDEIQVNLNEWREEEP